MARIRTVCERYPVGVNFQVLGLAEYRMGNYKLAIAAAEKSVRLILSQIGKPCPEPVDLGVLCKSHFLFGNRETAMEFQTKLIVAAKLPQFNSDESLSVISEVKDLLSGSYDDE